MHVLTIVDGSFANGDASTGMRKSFATEEEAIVELYSFCLTQIESKILHNELIGEMIGQSWFKDVLANEISRGRFTPDETIDKMKSVIFYNSAGGYEIMKIVIDWYFDFVSALPWYHARYDIVSASPALH